MKRLSGYILHQPLTFMIGISWTDCAFELFFGFFAISFVWGDDTL